MGSCVVDGLDTLSSTEENQGEKTLFSLSDSTDSFSGFTQITSS